MSVNVSIVGIVLSAAAAMVIGTVWYSPVLFGKEWMKIIGITNKDMKKKMNSVIVSLVIVSLVTAYVMSLFIAYTHNYIGGSWLRAGIVTSLLVWIGFATTTIFAHGLFEPRDKQVLYINTGNRLATLLAMGIILGSIMK